MEIGYTEEQEALRTRLRDYYDQLLTPEVEAQLADSHGIGPDMRRVVKQMAEDGWLGIGWPPRVRRPGPLRHRAVHLLRRGPARPGAPLPLAHHQHGRPDAHGVRHPTSRRTYFLPRILAGEHPLRDRLHRARAPAPTSRRCQTRARARRRRVRDQRAEDLHQHRRRRRLRLARVPHRPRGAEAQGHLDHHRADGHAGLLVADPLWAAISTNATFYDNVRVPVATSSATRTTGWKLITNQLNHERVAIVRPGSVDPALRRDRRWAQRDEAAPTAAASSTRNGCRSTWPGPRPARVPQADQLEGRVGRQPRVALDPADVVDHQGLRHRVLHRGLPAADGGDRPGRVPDPREPPGRVLAGRLEMYYAQSRSILTFGGGTNEMQRDLIAMFGLGMPRSLR